MTYCKPWNAGLCSEPRAVGRRLAKLMNALDTEINSNIAEGELVEDVRTLRVRMLDKLKAEGWRITHHGDRGWKVLPPRPARVKKPD